MTPPLTICWPDCAGAKRPKLLEHFKIALNKPDLILMTCEYAYAYCKSHDRLDEAEFWMSQAAERVAFEGI